MGNKATARRPFRRSTLNTASDGNPANCLANGDGWIQTGRFIRRPAQGFPKTSSERGDPSTPFVSASWRILISFGMTGVVFMSGRRFKPAAVRGYVLRRQDVQLFPSRRGKSIVLAWNRCAAHCPKTQLSSRPASRPL